MFRATFFVGDDDKIEERIEVARDGFRAFDLILNASRNQVLF